MPGRERSGFLELPDGGRLYREIGGRGSPVVFAHAGIADRRMWDREFRRYGSRHTVVRYDRRGLGRSSPATAAYSDVGDLELLREALGLGPVVLVGCSMGGRVAIDYALEHPESVRALLLVSPALSGWTPEFDPEGQPAYQRDAERFQPVLDAWKGGRREEAVERLREYWCAAQPAPTRRLVHTMMVENADEIFGDVSAAHQTGPDPPAVRRLGAIRAPTTVLYGDQDEPSSRYIAERVAREIPGAQFVRVAGADHLVNLSRPKEFDRAFEELAARAKAVVPA